MEQLEKEKEKVVIEYTDKLDKLSKIKNPILAAIEYGKILEWIGDLFNDGYKEGYKHGLEKGKTSWVKNVDSN